MNRETRNGAKVVRRMAVAALAALLMLLACSMPANAQTNQGSISGNVLDPSGAVVQNVKVVAKSTTTGATYETVSSTAGTYRFPNLNIGSYDLTATATGFKVATLKGVIVEVASTKSLDINLVAGSVTETVVVNSGTQTVQTETSEMGTVVTQSQVLDLPLALGSSVQYMRSPEAFVFLIP